VTAREVITILRQKISDAEQADVREVPLSNLRRLIDQIEQGISNDPATKSTAERHASYQKLALRSEAFARALSEAKLRVVGSGGLRSLFEQAARKAASLPRQPFKENWAYVQTMLRLVRAYERGEYQQVSNDALMWIVAALNYLVDPFDLIPDKTPFLGFIDDATVVGFVADKTRQALDDFMIWETMCHATQTL
jgi:uncharacterized membrane protein YkvA (DUF1232 family)